MINTWWFIVLSVMLIGYAVLDGFDLGVGIVHLLVGRRPRDRATAITAIGPVWNGNEVWLLAAGGAMVVAFPHLYAAAFSGFYLALMLVLWLLVLRGVAIEFRHQIHDPLWEIACDTVFAAASALLAVLFGVAVGNVLRGVPFDETGSFQGSFALLLNPFALLCGVLSLSALALHGTAYLAMKTSGELHARSRRLLLPLWGLTVALLAGVVAASSVVQPRFTWNFSRWPLLLAVPATGLAAIATIPLFIGKRRDGWTFAASCTTVAGVLGSAAAGLYPMLLPAIGDTVGGLDIHNTASAPSSMSTAMVVYLVGMAIVVVYMARAYRTWRGKVSEEQHYSF